MKLLAVFGAFFALLGLLVTAINEVAAPAMRNGSSADGTFAALEKMAQSQALPPGIDDVRGYWADQHANVSRATAVCQLDGVTVVLYHSVFWDEKRPHLEGKFCWPCYNKGRRSQNNINCLPHATWQDLATQGLIVRTTRASLWRAREPGDTFVEEDFRQDLVAVGRLRGVEVRDVFWHRTAIFLLAEGADEDKERLQDELNLDGHFPCVVP